MRAWRAGKEVTLGPPKQRATLALLASRVDEVVGIDQIVDALWGNDVPQTCVNGVHTYVAGLRRAFEPDRGHRDNSELLVSTAGGYSLRMNPGGIDADVFTRRHARARDLRAEGDRVGAAAAFDSALALWRGEAYAGIPGPFALVERARLRELRLTGIEEWAADLLMIGRHDETVAALAQAMAEEPLRERLSTLLMLALHRSGRQARALEVFRQTRELLAEELGIEPGAELRETHERMLAGDLTFDPGTAEPAVVVTRETPRLAQLPPGARGFVGRRWEMEMLQRLLTHDGPRRATVPPIAVIDGGAGVGKSAFALELAHALSDQFPDGQMYVDLGGTSQLREPATAAEALAFLLDSLGVDKAHLPRDLPGRTALYRSLLHGKRMLIVLDDALNAEQLRPLLPRGASCVVITSRRRQSGLAAREGAYRVEVGPLSPDESLELLADLVGEPEIRHSPDAERLADLCGHLPLALRIAAESLRADPHASLSAWAARYEDRHRRLAYLDVDGDAETSVRAALGACYRRLPAPAARLFRVLGTRAHNVITTREAAALLGTNESHVRSQLETLADRHLMREEGPETYGCHELVHLFAAECAREDAPLTVLSGQLQKTCREKAEAACRL